MFENICASLAAQEHRTSVGWHVWRKPRKEPLVDVDGAVFVAIHHQPTVRTPIRPLTKRHVLLAFAGVAHFGGTGFINHVQVFPKAYELVREHLYKAIEPPIVVHQAIPDLSLAPLFGGFLITICLWERSPMTTALSANR
jgi:hypothetical protein